MPQSKRQPTKGEGDTPCCVGGWVVSSCPACAGNPTRHGPCALCQGKGFTATECVRCFPPSSDGSSGRSSSSSTSGQQQKNNNKSKSSNSSVYWKDGGERRRSEGGGGGRGPTSINGVAAK
ncbi:MAG: hypothetical protein M1816_003175 [Peltula sp. TS41687]|nr:MAG: hypothetical protein M1816_003175 [Peltula sp. TS41687]